MSTENDPNTLRQTLTERVRRVGSLVIVREVLADAFPRRSKTDRTTVLDRARAHFRPLGYSVELEGEAWHGELRIERYDTGH